MTTRHRLPADLIVELYRAGAGAPAIASRLGCSQTGVRKVLLAAGVVMRARGGVSKPADTAEIVRLRDAERLSWEDIARQTGLSDEGARTRYRQQTGRLPNLEWHRTARQRPDLDPSALSAVNAAVDLKTRIGTAYLEGLSSAGQLARQYGISDRTVRRWAKSIRDTSAEDSDRQQRGFRSHTSDDIWCTPSEASRVLGVSPERVHQLIHREGVLPAETDIHGQLRLRQTEVLIALQAAGPPGSRGRWDIARRRLRPTDAQPSPSPKRRKRPSALVRRLEKLPWPEIVSRYEGGANITALAVELNVSRGTLRHYLLANGAHLRRGPARTRLPLTDDELRLRHAAGATLADLAAQCGTSTSIIWRHLHPAAQSDPARPWPQESTRSPRP